MTTPCPPAAGGSGEATGLFFGFLAIRCDPVLVGLLSQALEAGKSRWPSCRPRCIRGCRSSGHTSYSLYSRPTFLALKKSKPSFLVRADDFPRIVTDGRGRRAPRVIR